MSGFVIANLDIKNPEAYAKTGAPMFNKFSDKNINAPTKIYKLNLVGGKKYVGKTTNIDQRMNQHFSGNGSKVTKKFKPVDGKVVDECPGYFSDKLEQKYTDKYIKKNGYENVRGGKYTNSKTLKGKYHEYNDYNNEYESDEYDSDEYSVEYVSDEYYDDNNDYDSGFDENNIL